MFDGSDTLKVFSSYRIYRIVLEILRSIVGIARRRTELKEVRVKERERQAFRNGLLWGAGIGIAAVLLIWLFAARSLA